MSPFFDTNILVYAVSLAPEDAPKKAIAAPLIANGDFAISFQVIQEFIHSCLLKPRLGQTPEAITITADFLFDFPCAAPSRKQILRALALQQRFQLRYWDAAILASALELGCSEIYSEDFSPHQDYGGIRVVNPFAGT